MSKSSMSEILDFYQGMKEQNVLLAYKGNVSNELLGALFRLAEDKLGRYESKTPVKKKVFNILVEILQNIYHHMDDLSDKDDDSNVIAVLLSKVDSGYNIMTGNHVLNSKIEELRKRIDFINSMSSDELRDQYRQKLDKGGFSQKGGAGLGLMDIVRKSGDKLQYDFKQLNDDYSFFTLKVKILAID